MRSAVSCEEEYLTKLCLGFTKEATRALPRFRQYVRLPYIIYPSIHHPYYASISLFGAGSGLGGPIGGLLNDKFGWYV